MVERNIKLAVIASGGANFYSVEVALQRLGISYDLTTAKDIIAMADGIILPGVGSAAFAMKQLAQNDLIEVIRNYQKPLLGICLGMQLLYEFSCEGNVPCLGILSGTIQKFLPTDEVIVPQMGWNTLNKKRDSMLFDQVNFSQDVYFVHSYYAPLNEATLASCDYGQEFTAIAQKDNFYAMQFHPEKSGTAGALLLKNFIGVIRDNLSSN